VGGEKIKLLLVEDNPNDVDAIREALRQATHIELVCATRLAAGLERLAQGDIQVVLVDLGLLDAQGTDGFKRVRDAASAVPVIVLTAGKDEQAPLEALKSGAQDYLVKGKLDCDALTRAVRYSLERHLLLAQLAATGAKSGQEPAALKAVPLRPLKAPGFLSPALRAASETLSLEEYAPESFDAFVREYGELLELALGERKQGSAHDAKRVCRLAESFGNRNAGARDVVEVHRTALTLSAARAAAEDVRAYTEEGRLLVLELMGHLVSYYR
jgi:DNA-binding NarL/FixJ family response regulator